MSCNSFNKNGLMLKWRGHRKYLSDSYESVSISETFMALNSKFSHPFRHSCQHNKVSISVLQHWQSLSSSSAAKLKLNIPNICKDFEPDDPNLPSSPHSSAGHVIRQRWKCLEIERDTKKAKSPVFSVKFCWHANLFVSWSISAGKLR